MCNDLGLPLKGSGLWNKIKRFFSITILNQTRLYCTLSSYSIHLRERLAAFSGDTYSTKQLKICQEYYNKAQELYNLENWDASWRFLKNAKRHEIQTFSFIECQIKTNVLRRKKVDLKEWAQSAVEELLLPVKDCPDNAAGLAMARLRLEKAQKITDDYYDDEHMRIRILRRRINPISITFAFLVLLLLVGYGFRTQLSENFPALKNLKFIALLLSVLFGLLGACASVASDLITRFESSSLFRQFSEVSDSLRRISFGPVAAIVVLLALDAEFIPFLKKTDGLPLKCCYAFVAGFSERLVMKLVEKVGGTSK